MDFGFSSQVIVELASDSKEFPTQLARTKLAEMTGKAKIVPIAQTPTPDPSSTALYAAPKPPPAPQKSSYGELGPSAPRGIGKCGVFNAYFWITLKF